MQAALDSLLSEGQTLGRTTLVVAHRLSTIANVDRVVVLKAGRIVEMGSPSELRARGVCGGAGAGAGWGGQWVGSCCDSPCLLRFLGTCPWLCAAPRDWAAAQT